MFHCFYRFFRINIQYAHIAGRCIDRTRRDNPQEKNLQKKKKSGNLHSRRCAQQCQHMMPQTTTRFDHTHMQPTYQHRKKTHTHAQRHHHREQIQQAQMTKIGRSMLVIGRRIRMRMRHKTGAIDMHMRRENATTIIRQKHQYQRVAQCRVQKRYGVRII